MKKIIFYNLVIALLLTSNALMAQDYIPGHLYEGAIIAEDGSLNHGFVQYNSMQSMRNEITFYKDKNNKKTKKKYKPKDIAGYKVGAEEYKSIKWGMVIKQQVFALIVKKGHITMYHSAEQGENGQWDYVMVLQKGDEAPIGVARFIRFAKEMSEYISDYEELATKVANKEKGYRLLSMEAIIDEYNEWYAANH